MSGNGNTYAWTHGKRTFRAIEHTEDHYDDGFVSRFRLEVQEKSETRGSTLWRDVGEASSLTDAHLLSVSFR